MYSDDDYSTIDDALRRMASYQPNPRDAALGERWRDEEERTLKQLEGGEEYGIGQLLRDVLPGVIGMGADAITNEGRGLGNISMQMLGQADANAARDLQRQTSNREYALKQRAQREEGMGGSTFDRAYKTANVANSRLGRQFQEGNLGQRVEAGDRSERGLRVREDEHSYKYNPTDQRALDVVDELIAGGMGESARGLPTVALRDRRPVTDKEVDHAWAGIESDDKAVETTKTTDARERTELKHAPAKADAAANQAGKVATESTTKRIEAEAGLADVSAATDATKTAATTAARAGAEGDAAAGNYVPPLARAPLDPNRVRQQERDPKLAAKVNEELAASGEILEIIGDLVEVRKQEAQGLAKPGAARSFFDSSRGRLEGRISMSEAMGTLQDGDRRAIGSYLGNANASWTDLSVLLGSDVKLDQLEGVLQTFKNADQRKARAWGWSEFGTAPTATPPRNVDRPAARSGAPGPSASSGAAPPVAPGMVTIRLGGETRQVPADQAQRLKVINPSLEVF